MSNKPVPNAAVDDEFTVKTVDAAAPAQPATEPTKFRREIDLGDGSGRQVFEADSADELLDKLAEAQVNATRHIRQLTREASVRRAAVPDRAGAPTKYEPKPINADSEFVIAQQLASRPQQTIGQLIEAVTGVPPAKLADAVNRLNMLEYSYGADKAALEFVSDHTADYVACPENSSALTQFLTENQLPVTRNNLEFAFEALSHRGVLIAPGSDEQQPEDPQVKPAEPAAPNRSTGRIGQPTRNATGLSGRHAAVATAQLGLSEAELQSLPLHELRERIVRASREASA